MTYCFDIDDTICRHINRDYANAIPIDSTIQSMRDIRNADTNARIILFTARGMASCKGDALAADRKNRPILEQWLTKHNVPYDQLLFGKPLADFYIDDKAITPTELENSIVEQLNGFSGATIMHIGNYVVKTAPNASQQAAWYYAYQERFYYPYTPKVHSVVLDQIYLSFFNGVPLSTVKVKQQDIMQICDTINNFSLYGNGENDVNKYCRYIHERGVDFGIDTSKLEVELANLQILKQATFSHGDLTLSNILKDASGSLCIIDPNQKQWFTTHYLDVSKLCLSLRGLDVILHEGELQDHHLIDVLLAKYSDEELSAIRALEKSHILRILPYANGKDNIVEQLIELLKSI